MGPVAAPPSPSGDRPLAGNLGEGLPALVCEEGREGPAPSPNPTARPAPARSPQVTGAGSLPHTANLLPQRGPWASSLCRQEAAGVTRTPFLDQEPPLLLGGRQVLFTAHVEKTHTHKHSHTPPPPPAWRPGTQPRPERVAPEEPEGTCPPHWPAGHWAQSRGFLEGTADQPRTCPRGRAATPWKVPGKPRARHHPGLGAQNRPRLGLGPGALEEQQQELGPRRSISHTCPFCWVQPGPGRHAE